MSTEIKRCKRGHSGHYNAQGDCRLCNKIREQVLQDAVTTKSTRILTDLISGKGTWWGR